MDLHERMQKILEEKRKAYPDQAFRFVDSTPDVLRQRMDVDGWNPYKESDQKKAGANGEVRVGDLILASRPRKEDEEQAKRDQKKAYDQVHSPVNQFSSEIERLGGSKYLKPMSPEELERDRSKWGRR